MTQPPVETIEKELRRATHRATLHAYDLFHHLPELLDLLIPPTGQNGEKGERALAAEELIRAAIAAIAEYDDIAAQAILIFVGLKHDPTTQKYAPTLGPTLKKRQIEASDFLNVSIRTFTRSRERTLLSALAFEIRRIQRGNHEHPRAV